MKILSATEYSYYKEALKESVVLVEDVYSKKPCYNLRGISPMIAAVFLRITDLQAISNRNETKRISYILNKEEKEELGSG